MSLLVGILLLAEAIDCRTEELKAFWDFAGFKAGLGLGVEVSAWAGLSFFVFIFENV